MAASSLLRAYYQLSKPRVMMANALTAAAGYLLASAHLHHFVMGRFWALVVGSSLVIAAACAINNYLDRDIDSRMERTKQRVTVTGAVGKTGAIIFTAITSILGVIILIVWTNWLVVIAGVVGFIDYVWLYGALSKRRSVHGTLVGSISGAIPVLAGFVAVTDSLDAGAVLVFASLFFWQLPEFYSIVIYRRREYAAAGVPVISVVKGLDSTKRQIFIYTLLFLICSVLLSGVGYAGITYLAVMLGVGLYWLFIAAAGFKLKPAQSEVWARRMFHWSMVVILIFCLMLSVGGWLP